MFKEVVSEYLSEELKMFILKENVTFVFEVVHKNDPHIVDYQGENFVILLDIVKNKLAEEKFDFYSLQQIGMEFGFMVKYKISEIKSYKELKDFINLINRNKIFTNEGIEGAVIEFEDGHKVKVKTDWYKFWKIWRGKKFHIAKIKNNYSQIIQAKEKLHTYEDQVLFRYLIENYTGDLEEDDIITIRKKFLSWLKKEDK